MTQIFEHFSTETDFNKKCEHGLSLWSNHLSKGDPLDIELLNELASSVVARRWLMSRVVCHPNAYLALCKTYAYEHLRVGVTHMRHLPVLPQPSSACLKYFFAAKIKLPGELLEDIKEAQLNSDADATALALLLSDQELNKLLALVGGHPVLQLAHSIKALIDAKDNANMVFVLDEVSRDWFSCKAYRNLRRSGIRDTARNHKKGDAYPAFIEYFVGGADVDAPASMAAMAIEFLEFLKRQMPDAPELLAGKEKVRIIVNHVCSSEKSALQLWLNPKEENNATV
jgi:hypothetical protein